MALEIKVSKDIKHIESDHFGEKMTEKEPTGSLRTNKITEFIAAIHQDFKPESFEQKEVTITKLETHAKVNKDNLDLGDLSFSISKEDAASIIDEILSIVKDPLLLAKLFKDLDTALGKEMEKHNIHFSDKDTPSFLIAGKGNYIPGPPPDNYHPKKKEELLDKLLLKREQKNKLNMEGSAPKFVGFVDSEQADPLVASGHPFTEDKQNSRLLLHGSFSHRLMIDALSQHKFLYDNGKELTPLQLIELLVRGKYYKSFKASVLKRDPKSLWSVTIDNVGDTPNSLNPDLYNFSCRSPFVLNSFLLCFGKEADLPNLQNYLLDSHWKAAYEMVYRVKQSMSAKDIPDSQIYTYCMEALSTTKGLPGEVGMKLPFTLDEEDSQKNPMYERFDKEGLASIVKKKPRSLSATGEYSSWDEFFESKKQKYSRFFNKQSPITTEHKKDAITEVNVKPEIISEQIPSSKKESKVETKPVEESQAIHKEQESITVTWNNIKNAIKNNLPYSLTRELQKFTPSFPSLIIQLFTLAATQRAKDCLPVLIKAGLDINIIDEDDKKTAWMKMKEINDAEGMKLLEDAGSLSAQSDKNSKMAVSTSTSTDYQTILNNLEAAIKANDPELFRTWLQQWGTVSPSHAVRFFTLTAQNRADECLYVLMDIGCDINSVNSLDETALSSAKENSDYGAMLMLVKAGADKAPSFLNKSTFLSSPGVKASMSSLALRILNQLKEDINIESGTEDDKRLLSDMQHLIREKSSNHQILIILLDYMARNANMNLSLGVKHKINDIIDNLLEAKETPQSIFSKKT